MAGGKLSRRSSVRRHAKAAENPPAGAHAKSAAPAIAPEISLPPAAFFSFLKDTRGVTAWSLDDFRKTLGLTTAAARQALAILEMQGYIHSHAGEWMTTPAGETVSGSKFPRFNLATLERSLASFAEHIRRVNADRAAPYKIVEAVAFGDFLTSRTPVQAADIGISLVPRNSSDVAARAPAQERSQRAFLKHLRGRTPLINVLPYARWMSQRSHRDLLHDRVRSRGAS